MSRLHPPLRPYARGLVRAWTAEEATAFDRRAIDVVGVPQPVLMENAGRAVAAVAGRLSGDGPVVAVVGSGNNGGDALVAARTLAAWGRDVSAILVADRPADDPLLHGWPLRVVHDEGLDGEGWTRALAGAALLLDGILGTGARGAPRARQAAAIEAIVASGVPVLAVDVPSGVDATTGAVAGSAVRAVATVALGAPKLGALLHPARALVGRHVAVEIGFPPPPASGAVVATPAWARARRPRRGTDTHKNAVGRVAVVGGRPGMAGAAVLAVRAAFRSGAGLVRVVSHPDDRAVLQSTVPEAIFVPSDDEAGVAGALAAADAIVVGPGLGTDERARSLVGAVAEADAPVVVDADALNLAAAGALDLASLSGGRAVLITPHPGEMGRLLPDADGDAVTRARAAARSFGCTVLLKGAPSVVVGAQGEAIVDTQSSSDVAVAGMGDVLAGACGALLAQGLVPAEAGAVGLYLSGRAARIAGRGAALTPTDVVRRLPEALSEEGVAETDLDLPFVTFDADAAR